MSSPRSRVREILAGAAPLPAGMKSREQYHATGGRSWRGYVAGFCKVTSTISTRVKR